MKKPKHLILTQDYQGWEYGMLRCLEDEIQRQTGATVLYIPKSSLAGKVLLWKRLQHGTRYEVLRKYLPKKRIEIPANIDVVWHVLMGPENYELDLFDWPWKRVPHRVVYLFDTLPTQMKRIGRLFSGSEWNIPITSFQDAMPLLKKTTGRNWHQIDQAVSMKYFPAKNSKEIAFSSYGRRHPLVHEAIKKFCLQHSIYYDYTTHGRTAPTADPLELYRQYAWHMSQSQFTVCWPVEVTHPERAGGLSPITCRWFEAVAAGAVAVGKEPRNLRFREMFGNNLILDINPDAGTSKILKRLGEIWNRRSSLSMKSETFRRKMVSKIDWSERVGRMLEHIQQKTTSIK